MWWTRRISTVSRETAFLVFGAVVETGPKVPGQHGAEGMFRSQAKGVTTPKTELESKFSEEPNLPQSRKPIIIQIVLK